MKVTAHWHFPFDACFEEEGSDKMIQFEINFSWRVPRFNPQHETFQLVHSESRYCLDEEGFIMDGIRLRYHAHGTRCSLRRGRDRRRFRIAASGSGGNIFWDTIQLRRKDEPHLLNYLRRQDLFDLSEWDNDFVDTVWRQRQTITRRDLDRWALHAIRIRLAEEAKSRGLQKLTDLFPNEQPVP